MIRWAALLACIAACWTAGPAPAPPPARPEPIAEPKPRSRWKKSEPLAHVEPAASERNPRDIANDLASELRSRGAHAMQSFIAGPIVVLDLDAGTLTTVCDLAAVAAAQKWGTMFADPARGRPSCRPSANYTCTQFAHQSMLVVELAEPDAWRIVSVIVGNYRTGRTTLHMQMSKMRAQVTTATCP